MKYPLFFLLLLTIPYFSVAQVTSEQDARANFVGLQNGQRVYAKRVQLKSPLLKSNYFLLDDTTRFSVSAVRYYQNENGFFLKILDPLGGREDFARRLMSGRISKYYTTRTTYDNFSRPGFGYGGWNTFGAPTRRDIYFFTKDEGDIQLFTFENLREALSDNPGSLELLARYRKQRYVDTGLSIAGAAILLYGVTQSLNTSSSATGGFNLSPVVYVGAAVISLPWLTGLFRKDKLTQAVELYNFQKKE
jgi:hypothetical protein